MAFLAGPNYWMYTFESRGVVRTRLITPSTGEPLVITTSWKDYGGPAYRNKITVDQLGDFYLIDAKGKLRWSRFNPGQLKWDSYNVVVASGWERFDLIVAAGAGVDNGTWPIGGTRIGIGWGTFDNVVAKPDACRLAA